MAISQLPQPVRGQKGPPCDVCVALAGLSKAEAKALRGHLANPAWRYSELAEAIRVDPDTPFEPSAYSLARHARGHCAARDKLR